MIKIDYSITAFIALVVAFCVTVPANAKMAMQKTYREMEKIVASQGLTKNQKLVAISAYFAKEPYWHSVLYRLDKVDKTKAQEIALELFRKPGTSRVHKYQLGDSSSQA